MNEMLFRKEEQYTASLPLWKKPCNNFIHRAIG